MCRFIIFLLILSALVGPGVSLAFNHSFRGQCLTDEQAISAVEQLYPQVVGNYSVSITDGSCNFQPWDMHYIYCDGSKWDLINGGNSNSSGMMMSFPECSSPGFNDFDPALASQIFAFGFSTVLGFFFLSYVIRGIFVSMGIHFPK
jgi:hypothetical protein